MGVQRLANETALQVAVCHFPAGTSKWNKIEHLPINITSFQKLSFGFRFGKIYPLQEKVNDFFQN
jgi:hypothetical protein